MADGQPSLSTASPITRARPEQARLKLRSCSNNKQWTEFLRDTTGKINIAKIIDLGHQKSSRKESKKKNISKNKQEPNSGVAKLINMFEEAPTRRSTARKNKIINKHKFMQEAEKIKGSKNKQEKNTDAATKPPKPPRTKKKNKPSIIGTYMKMTSPTQENITSILAKKMKSDSPGLSTRMKPRSRKDTGKLLKLVKPDDQNSS
jgi:hypothetical protein